MLQFLFWALKRNVYHTRIKHDCSWYVSTQALQWTANESFCKPSTGLTEEGAYEKLGERRASVW